MSISPSSGSRRPASSLTLQENPVRQPSKKKQRLAEKSKFNWPDDITNHIFSFLAGEDVYKASRTCKLFLNQTVFIQKFSSFELSDKNLITIIKKSKDIKFLSLRRSNLTSTALFHLKKLQHLTYLDLHNCKNLVDQDLEQIAAVKTLQNLNISSCKQITDNGLRHVATIPTLKNLNISYCTRISGTGLAHLTSLPLEHLDICSLYLYDANLGHLNSLPLKSLKLGCSKWLTDEALSVLKSSTLEDLDLYSCKAITNVALASLREITSLKALNKRGRAVSFL